MSNQRKSCFANGRFWIFDVNGTYFNAYSSTDGNLWTSKVIRVSNNPGEDHSIWCGNSNTFAYSMGGNTVVYRKGLLNGDGSITWTTASEQTAVAAQTDVTYGDVNIAFDSSNEPWIGYYRNYASNSTRNAYVTMCTFTNGTWLPTCDPTAFPSKLSPINAGSSRFVVTPVPLTSGKMIIEYVSGSDLKFRDRIYYSSNRSLGPEEMPLSTLLGSVYAYSSVAQGDDVDLVINAASTYNVVFYKRSFSSGIWSLPSILQSSTTSTTDPVISTNGSTNDLYVFWAGSPTINHIYYREFQGSNGMWLGKVDWVSESAVTGNDRLTTFYQSSNNYIGLAWMAGSSNPYDIRFAELSAT